MPTDVQITSDSDMEAMLEEFKARERIHNCGLKYTCSISGCNGSFKRLDHLDRHEYHHTGIKRHACCYEGCDKTYATVTHLKRHSRSVHERLKSPQKTIKCSLQACSKMFTSKSNMQRHVRDTHENPREYTCTHCSAKFRQKMKLRRHEISQHTKQYPFRCKKCARGYYRQWQQENHQRQCKVYACPKCELNFDKWSLYIKHCREAQHSHQLHKCGHCDRSYVKPSNLAAHITSKHFTKSELTFSCTVPGCSRSYSYERNLRQHVLSVHCGRKFECLAVGCHRCFSSAQNLSKHSLREHTFRQSGPVIKKSYPTTCSIRAAKDSRKRRRDAGQPACSFLSKIVGVVLDKNVDMEVRKREPLSLISVANELQEQQL